ncbi:MAG TPA: hypothetical protein VEA59_04345 [Patescibacteria group bacterium]|nr:hypothetical protein [Patescibacteria group bacterium]
MTNKLPNNYPVSAPSGAGKGNTDDQSLSDLQDKYCPQCKIARSSMHEFCTKCGTSLVPLLDGLIDEE